MARIRTIKPEFFTDEKIADLSPTARYLFIGMWCFCDDQGIHPASPKQIKMEIFPADDLSIEQIISFLNELLDLRLLDEYESMGKRYWLVTGWKHQKIEKPNKKYPFPEPSQIIRRLFAEQTPEESKGRESKGKEGSNTPPPPKGGGSAEILPFDDLPILMEGFEVSWKQWPRKEGKKAAQKAWLSAIKKVPLVRIFDSVNQFTAAFDEDPRPHAEKLQFCKHFSSWLNGERWEDYPAGGGNAPPDRSGISQTERTRQVLLDAGLTPLL